MLSFGIMLKRLTNTNSSQTSKGETDNKTCVSVSLGGLSNSGNAMTGVESLEYSAATCGQATSDAASCGQAASDTDLCGQETSDTDSCGQVTSDAASCGQATSDTASCGHATSDTDSCGQVTSDTDSCGQATCGPAWTFDLLGPVGEQLLCPACISVSTTGEFVVSDTDSCFVVIYSKSGAYMSHFSTLPTRTLYMFMDINKYRPHDVAWLSSKHVIYTKPAGCQVTVCDWKGNPSVTIEGRPLYEPYGICVDELDKIYITDRVKGRILCYNCDGKLIKSFGVFGSTDTLSNPHYITVTHNGDICVNDLRKDEIHVLVYSKSGKYSQVVKKGGNQGVGCISADSEDGVLQVDLERDRLVVCHTPKPNGFVGKGKHSQGLNGYLQRDTDPSLQVCTTVTSDLGGIALTNDGHLACIDRKHKKVKVYNWLDHRAKLQV